MRCTATAECGSELYFEKQSAGDSYWAICHGCGRMYEGDRANPDPKKVLALEGNGIDIRLLPSNSRTIAETVAA